MAREYNKDSMLKSKGILYFPPIKDRDEVINVYNECGGMILSLEEDGYLVEEPIKICRLYNIEVKHLELYFKQALTSLEYSQEEIDREIEKWIVEEGIKNLSV